MPNWRALVFLIVLTTAFGCSDRDTEPHEGPDSPVVDTVRDAEPQEGPDSLVVDSVVDEFAPFDGRLTLREAVDMIADGGTIRFASDLDGATIALHIVGEEHATLVGEVMGFDEENRVSYLVGYYDRDYGKTALCARKSITIDASGLPSGVTIAWAGAEPARVLTVYGDLTLRNVRITGGVSRAEKIEGHTDASDAGGRFSQPWTLARGGGIAVWGVARLEDVVIYDNHCEGDFEPARDRGAYGGGVFADVCEIAGSVISGNTVVGFGAAGGGVFTVGGVGSDKDESTITRSSITGNRVAGVFSYGGGVYTDGGGIGKRKTLRITQSTIAVNMVAPVPDISAPLLRIGYWRGGGVYMSNGDLCLSHTTIAKNRVVGLPRIDDDTKPNLAGGVAATIGRAHTAETFTIDRSIIVGNTVEEIDINWRTQEMYQQDVFTGSLHHFYSGGYNVIGAIDFTQILPPVPQWQSLSRKHWPKVGDRYGVDPDTVLESPVRHRSIVSYGSDEGAQAVLWYPPTGEVVDQVPSSSYTVEYVLAEVVGFDYEQPEALGEFLVYVLEHAEEQTGTEGLVQDFVDDFTAWLASVDANPMVEGRQPYETPNGTPILDLNKTLWFGPPFTWPANASNFPWIGFWRSLDEVLVEHFGPQGAADAFWATFLPVPLERGLSYRAATIDRNFTPAPVDQLGTTRTGLADIGAIERGF